MSKTAHWKQNASDHNGPNLGPFWSGPQWKKKNKTKTAQANIQNVLDILMSKTAHYVTLYKYRINVVIKCTWGIPYKCVDAAAVVAAHLSVRRACVSTADMTLTSCAGNTNPVQRSREKLKNYENQSINDEVTTRNAIAYFLDHPVYWK